jgi:hypothetical protein
MWEMRLLEFVHVTPNPFWYVIVTWLPLVS